MEENKNRTVLYIYKNWKETIDCLPKKYRGRAWELVINYAYGENIELEKENCYIQMAVKSLLPLAKLKCKSGSQGGKSNNPSGKKKTNLGANLGANLGDNLGAIPYKEENKEENKEEIKTKFGEFKNVFLTGKEYKKLKEIYAGKLEQAINILSSYIASKGKKYKSHYAVLGKHNWVYEKLCKKEENKYNKNDFGSGLF